MLIFFIERIIIQITAVQILMDLTVYSLTKGFSIYCALLLKGFVLNKAYSI